MLGVNSDSKIYTEITIPWLRVGNQMHKHKHDIISGGCLCQGDVGEKTLKCGDSVSGVTSQLSTKQRM